LYILVFTFLDSSLFSIQIIWMVCQDNTKECATTTFTSIPIYLFAKCYLPSYGPP
jgi:hypothetical protein